MRPKADQVFTLTQAHLNLLRQATVVWAPVESGAPAVLISPVEISGSAEAIQADIGRRAGLVAGGQADLSHAQGLLDQLPEALAQMLFHGELASGRYEYANPLVQFPDGAQSLPAELRSLESEKTVAFDLTAQHKALLRGARWQGLWMNAKRPYGDMTYFELDMADILGQPLATGENGYLPAEQEQQLWRLHTEMLPALQVYLQHAAINSGTYPYIGVEPRLG
jgi:hypothetical protein